MTAVVKSLVYEYPKDIDGDISARNAFPKRAGDSASPAERAFVKITPESQGEVGRT